LRNCATNAATATAATGSIIIQIYKKTIKKQIPRTQIDETHFISIKVARCAQQNELEVGNEKKKRARGCNSLRKVHKENEKWSWKFDVGSNFEVTCKWQF